MTRVSTRSGVRLVIPNVAAANRIYREPCGVDAQGIRAPLQVQRYNTIAARQCRGERIVIDACVAERLACEAVRRTTNGVVDLRRNRFVHFERKRYHAVAAVSRRVDVRVDRTVRVDAVSPDKRGANSGVAIRKYVAYDCQVERSRTVTSVNRTVAVRVVTRSGEALTVPRIDVTCCDSKLGVERLVDSKRQSYHAVASRSAAQYLRVRTR